jgi:hypothetical protein
MKEIEYSLQWHGVPNNDSVRHGHRSYWKRAHRNWRLWVAAIVTLAAMIIYVMSEDVA